MEEKTEVKEKVVAGEVTTKKKSRAAKLKNAIFSNEDIADMKEYAVYDVMIPKLKEAFAEAFTNIVNTALGTNIRVSSSVTGTNFNYNKASTQSVQQRRNDIRVENNSIADYDTIVLASKDDAEAVLCSMMNCIDEYGSTCISDLYEFVGKTAPYTGRKYGWKDLRSARVKKVAEGYWLDLPKATFLG